MARGGKRSHKGRNKSFTNPEALERQRIKDEKEREWRKQRGEIDSESSEDDSEDGSGSDSSGSGNDASGSEDGIAFAKEPAEEGAAGGAKPKKGADKGAKKQQMPPRDMPPSSSSESDSEDEKPKAKGVSGLIDVENPNLAVKKNKKISQVDAAASAGKKEAAAPQLSRREREEIEKARAKARYQKLHAEGKTDEAKADLARLAIIRKQREDAEKKRQDERLAKENAAKQQREEKVGAKKKTR